MSRFVKPEVVRIPISNSDYLDVKKRLTAGEQEDMLAQMVPTMTPGEAIKADSRQVRIARVLAYLVGWSLMDDDKPVPMSPALPVAVRVSTVENLDPEDFAEIWQAISTHEDTQEKARQAAKNGQGGESGSSAISSSPSTTAGGMNGSAS